MSDDSFYYDHYASVAKLEEKWWGAQLSPLGVYGCLMLKLEGAYMVKQANYK
jgi:hypothetical protein